MMSIFEAAVDAMFEGPMGEDAWVTPMGGFERPDPVRVLVSAPDVMTPILDVRVVSASAAIEVRLSEVAALGDGDAFRLSDGTVYTVLGKPRRDDTRLFWLASATEGA